MDFKCHSICRESCLETANSIFANPYIFSQRLDVNSVLKDKTGALISFKYSGIIGMTPEVGAVLGGAPEAKSTHFGNIGRY
jgi:hypothetical protein